jgi:hypothetical protein
MIWNCSLVQLRLTTAAEVTGPAALDAVQADGGHGLLWLRLDGHLMQAIADGALAGTWPCPVTADRAARMTGARTAATPLPSPPLPAGSIATRRRVHADGRISFNRQMMKLGPRHAGKLVTVII